MPRKPTKITDKIAKKRKCDSLREGEGCEQKVLDALSKRQKIKKNDCDDHADFAQSKTVGHDSN